MKINFAHIRHPSTSGGNIDFAVFEARASSNTATGNQTILNQLTVAARSAGHKIDQPAIAFSENGRLKFFGDKNLIDFLSKSGLPRWTHSIDI